MPPNSEFREQPSVCIANRAPFIGGAEVAAERLALGLQIRGWRVVMLVGERGAVLDRYQAAGLQCHFVPMAHTDWYRPWCTLKSWWRLRQILKRERPLLIHSNDLPTHQMISWVAKQLGIPRICHHRFPFDGISIDWFNKYGAERHLFVSQALMDEMCLSSASLSKAPRAVLYDGLPIPEAPTSEARQHARRELGLPLEPVVVLFAGQIIERKGVAELLHAWANLTALSKSNATLILAGDDLAGAGAYRLRMESLAQDIGVPAQFVGFQRDLRPWLLAADIACVPSLVEPLGNATLEAMAYELPVIGSQVGGIPEMIVHEQCGLLVPPRDVKQLSAALARLIDNPVLRQQLGKEARKRCKEMFGLDIHIDNTIREYKFLTADRHLLLRKG